MFSRQAFVREGKPVNTGLPVVKGKINPVDTFGPTKVSPAFAAMHYIRGPMVAIPR